MNVLLSTFGVGVLSALVPFVNLEAYLAGVAVMIGIHGLWALPMTAAAGQVVGKVAWYEAGRSSVRVGVVRRTLESPRWGWMIARLHTIMRRSAWTRKTSTPGGHCLRICGREELAARRCSSFVTTIQRF